MSDSRRHIASMPQDDIAPHVLTTGKPEEGEARGDGWTVVRALMLILGGIAIVSYAMVALANMEG